MSDIGLKIEVEMLRERIIELEEALTGTTLLPREFRLTESEARLLGVLMQRADANRDVIMAALYRDIHKDEPDPKIVDIFICNIRKKLKPFGIEILTRWGQGYEMPPGSKQIVRDMQAARAAA